MKWTEQEVEYLRENYYKMSLRDISEKLGRSYAAVYYKAKMSGIAYSNCDFAEKERLRTRKSQRAYYDKYKDKYKAYYQATRDDRLSYQKEYRRTHQDTIKAYQSIYYDEHKESRKPYLKAYYQANKEYILAQQKAYRERKKLQGGECNV